MALDAVGQAMGLALFGSLIPLLLGAAVIEDIIVVSVLAVLQSVAATGNLSFQDIGISTGLVLAFIGGVLFIGSRTVPRFVDIIGKTNHHDLVVVVAVLGVAFGLAFIANHLGISVVAGAFFAGVLVAESRSHAIARWVLSMPLRDMFAALFFVSSRGADGHQHAAALYRPCTGLDRNIVWGEVCDRVYFSSKILGTDKKTSMKAGFALSASRGRGMSWRL